MEEQMGVKNYQPSDKDYFKGIPKEWFCTIKVVNPQSNKTNLNYKCLINGCNKLFKKSCNLKDHFRKHTGVRPFQCQICHRYFTQIGNLKKHQIIIHGNNEEPKITVHNQLYMHKDNFMPKYQPDPAQIVHLKDLPHQPVPPQRRSRQNNKFYIPKRELKQEEK